MKTGRKGPTQAEQDRIWAARSEGLTDAEVARRLGLRRHAVNNFLLACGGIAPRRPRRRAERCLSLAEREEISRGIARGDSDRRIGRVIGRSHTTIGREIECSGGRRGGVDPSPAAQARQARGLPRAARGGDRALAPRPLPRADRGLAQAPTPRQ